MTNRKKLFIILGLSLFVLCLCISCFLLIYFYNSSPSGYPDNDSINYLEIPIEDYLGFSRFEVIVNNNEDLVLEIAKFYEGMEEAAEIENRLLSSSKNENPDDFFNALTDYNRELFEQIHRVQALAQFSDQGLEDDNVGSFPFILSVKAKERFSYWYYVPIIGSLLKSKHQSIETSRSGIYEYMSQELTDAERNEFLNEYGLDSIQDIKNASDSTIETLARDPELRASINWTKIATDLGENAVIATTESIKIGPSRNPALSTVINGAVRIFTKSGQDVPDSTPLTIMIPDEVIDQIDQIMPEENGSDIDQIPIQDLNELLSNIGGTESLLAINSEGENNAYLNVGNWNAVTTMLGAAPVIYEVNIIQDQVININVPMTNVEQYLLDPTIALNLGFDVVIEQQDIELTSCLDISAGMSIDSKAELICKNNYESCQKNPYTIEQGYSDCISAGGGCWDIGRWEYINDDNCPIDSSFNLNYEDKRLQPDYEYFGPGNRAYCECIVECRKQYWVKKDCNSQLRSCCEAITE